MSLASLFNLCYNILHTQGQQNIIVNSRLSSEERQFHHGTLFILPALYNRLSDINFTKAMQ